jgi:hypothetical protein
MKTFLVTLGAVLLGVFAWSFLTGRKRKTVTYTDPATGVKHTVDAGTVTQNKDGDVLFEGPDIDRVTGAYLPPGAKSGTVGFLNDGMAGYNTQ